MVRTVRKEIRPRDRAGPSADDPEPARTGHGPRADAVADGPAREAERRPGLLSVSLMAGFPYADVPEMGPSVIAVADGERARLAQDVADELAGRMWEARARALRPLPGPGRGGAHARLPPIEAPGRPRRPRRQHRRRLGRGRHGPAGGADPAAGDGAVVSCSTTRTRSRSQGRQVPEAASKCAVGGRVDQLHGDPVRVRGRGAVAARRDLGRRPGPARRAPVQRPGPTAVVTIDGRQHAGAELAAHAAVQPGAAHQPRDRPARAQAIVVQGGRCLQGGLRARSPAGHRGGHARPDRHRPGPLHLQRTFAGRCSRWTTEPASGR